MQRVGVFITPPSIQPRFWLFVLRYSLYHPTLTYLRLFALRSLFLYFVSAASLTHRLRHLHCQRSITQHLITTTVKNENSSTMWVHVPM